MMIPRATIPSSVWLALACALLTGCASTPKIDWDTRVGNYTYDQAVLELGPPDKAAELTDGTLVADWYSRTSGPMFSFGLGTGFYGRSSAVSVGQSIGTAPSGQALRLTFGRDHRLLAWSGRYR